MPVAHRDMGSVLWEFKVWPVFLELQWQSLITLPLPRADDPPRLGEQKGSRQGVGPIFRQKIPLF